MLLPLTLLPLVLLLSLPASASEVPSGPALGGDTSRATRGFAALSLPAANLSFEESERFFRGFLLFHSDWGNEPAPQQAGLGLGPLYNATACGACHQNDGRGPAPQPGEAIATSTLQVARLQGPDWGPHPTIGRQLQPFATEGLGEGEVTVTWEEIHGHYDDGRTYRLRRPILTVDGEGLLPSDSLSLRLAPALTGLGLLEAVPEETLLSLGDETGGQVRYLDDGAIGRFGWKANVARLADQVTQAAHEDMGLTSEDFPEGSDLPELSPDAEADLTFYSQVLAVPLAEDLAEQERGRILFAELGCASCHRSGLTTGNHILSALSEQVIHPFTDLLLHDMGDGLADRRVDGSLSDHPDSRLWRTPPLWALGKTEQVAGEWALLHDGRARSPAEAILWHGGEAGAAREAFKALDLTDRQALLDFLRAL